MSTTTGAWYKEKSLSALLKAVVKDILTEPLQFDKVLQGSVTRAQNYRGSRCLVLPFGPTNAGSSLANLLTAQTKLEVVLRKSPSAKDNLSSPAGNNSTTGRGKLAIVGMSGRFPDAASHEKLWELLENGLDVHREVPKDRFPVSSHVDVTGKGRNTSHTPYGCWIENPGMFDPRFFNMSPREAYQTDPMQRMALATAYEALEMSGYVPNRTPSTRLDRIGTFYGQTSDDWREINAAQDVDTYYITGGVRAFGPGRINYHFGFSGPSFNIDTACSSSAAAIQLACTSLWAKDCDTAIVGGLSCMTNSDIFAGLSRGQFLSKKGPCATFDNDADGYCRADGVGTVIVKRLEDAEADKDNILAVILGTATNHSADAVSITHPHGGTQELLYKKILDQAGVDPLDIDYVEMHGTGTQAGDGTEMKSVTNVFAPADRKRSAEQPLYLGAVKANVGHGEAASGVTALIKVLMMLQKNAIPPHVGIKNTINKTFPKDLAERNVNIAFKKTPLLPKAPGVPRKVFVNNFSAAGGNTGLLLEDGPLNPAAKADPRSAHVIAVTAKSKSAMLRNAERLIAYMAEHPEASISDISYTTTARRIQHNWRMNVTASDVSQAKVLLKAKTQEEFVPVTAQEPKVAFTFTGQGSHYAGLGKDLLEHSSIFRTQINEMDNIAKMHGFPSFLPLINGSVKDISTLSPVVTQLGLASFEMAMARLWESWGIKPSVVVGHSLGEYAALNVAGVLSVSDTIFLVGHRAQLLVDKCTANTHAMVAVQASVATVEETLGAEMSKVNVACINGPRETVLSGEAAQMATVAQKFSASGIKSTQLKVPFAFHSAQVDPILEDFEKLAASVSFAAPKIPVISPFLGKLLDDGETVNPAYLKDHAREAVNFLGSITSAQKAGLINEKTAWLEVGPHPVCLGMVKGAFGTSTIAAPSLRRNESTWKTITTSLCTLHTSGLNIDWNEYHRDFITSVHLLDLPTYSYDDKNYWIQYEGDWSLHKGRFPEQKKIAQIEEVKSSLSTTSVQKVIKESVKGNTAHIIIESDLADPKLEAAILGHMVNGTGLCPSSLYGDMAMTVADYAYKLIRPGSESVGMNVAHMEVPKPLIRKAKSGSQILRLEAKVDLDRSRVELVYTSGTDKSRTQHASCHVEYGDQSAWLEEWQKNAYLIQSRIEWLQEATESGKANKLARGMTYKLFGALVDYDNKYRGLEEVILHSSNAEATAKVKFQATEKDGDYLCSPYWIDSIGHLSGFILNGSDVVDSKVSVYVSHGWGGLRIAAPLSADKTYRSYVRMQSVGKTMMAGDVYLFDGEKVIAVFEAVRFQCIPRKVLNTFLPPAGTSAPVAAPVSKSIKTSTTQVQKTKTKTVETSQVSMTNISSVNQKLISVCSQAMDILAKEIGVELEELVDNIAFSDLGVDSLMSLTVSGRMREEMELEIDSSMFNDHPTIGEFKKYLSKFEKQSVVMVSPTRVIADEPTPELESDLSTPTDDSASDVSKDSSLGEIILTTIASEMGFEVHEIADAPDLASLGMDSLMSLSILGSLREKTGMTLPADLLIANPSIKDIERSLNIGAPQVVTVTEVQTKAVKSLAVVPDRKASSVLLQGNSRTAARHLWIVPDGSGSATSYVDIPDLNPKLAVWGLNSPYMKTPEEYTCGVYGMATKMITEMKRRQPTGPYHLAGWSAGGVIAFEITNQLIKAGNEVNQLILLDTPCPLIIEPLPMGLHQWINSIGLLGDGDPNKIPSWLLPHFAASVRALSTYTAEVIDPEKCPNVTAIWCEDGICKNPTDPRPDPYPTGHALFLLDNRTDFGPNLWDTYLNPAKFTSKTMPGNHFSMMKKPYVSTRRNLYLSRHSLLTHTCRSSNSEI
jgi:iterative type I PKS product template protein